jgi:hypothetical protein
MTFEENKINGCQTMTTQPTQGRCGSCEHWVRFTDVGAIKFHGAYSGKCKSPKFVYCGANQKTPQKTPKDGLSYWDYESYAAGFDTGEDFGCVHWSAKSTA